MVIKIKGKDDIFLETFEDFFNYVSIEVIKNLKQDINSKLYNYFISNVTIIGIKKFRNDIKSMFFNKTLLNKKYWISRGWSEKETIIKIKNIQLERSNVSKINMQKLKEQDYSEWAKKKNTKIEYYLDKGYSYEESEKLLKNRQKTFSLDICISKYGEDGYVVWKERQIKWVDKIKDIKFNKDTNSSKFYKDKYGNGWIYKAIEQLSFLSKNIIIDIIKITNDNFISFIKEYNNIREVLSMNDVYFIYNSVILQDFFNLSKQEMSSIIKNELKINIKAFGNVRYFNNHICRSNGEYYIAKKLKENNIYYEYEKKYPNNKNVSDFFIPKLKLYVEYMGMIKSDYIKTNHPDIYEKYITRYNTKESYCIENKINYLFEKDYKLLINKIIKLYGNKN